MTTALTLGDDAVIAVLVVDCFSKARWCTACARGRQERAVRCYSDLGRLLRNFSFTRRSLCRVQFR